MSNPMVYYNQLRGTPKIEEVQKMVKVYGLEKVEEIAAKWEAEKKVEKLSKQHQIRHLVEQGVDKEMAKIMVNAFMAAGLTAC